MDLFWTVLFPLLLAIAGNIIYQIGLKRGERKAYKKFFRGADNLKKSVTKSKIQSPHNTTNLHQSCRSTPLPDQNAQARLDENDILNAEVIE